MRHWLQDVGSTFGIGANGRHDWWEGWETLYSRRRRVEAHLLAGLPPVAVADGRTTRSTTPSASSKARSSIRRRGSPVLPGAFLAARDDDNFWAARRVVAFTDDMIRTVVKAARFSDQAAEKLLADVLIARRDKIARPTCRRSIPSSTSPSILRRPDLRERRRRCARRRAPDRRLPAEWAQFDNATGQARLLEPGPARPPRACGAVRTADHGRHLHPCRAERGHARHRVLGETGACALQANRRILEARGIRAADGTGRA